MKTLAFAFATTAMAATAATGFASAASATDDVSIMLDWIPSGWHSALLYGVQQGCFSDQDINLTLERGAGGADAVTKVASGSAPFGMADMGTMILAVAKGDADLKAIMPVGMNSPFGIMTLEAAPISSLKELEGKRLAAGPGDSNIKVLPYAMTLQDADFSKVDFESVDFSALLGMLLRGQIDAFTTFKTTGDILAPVAQEAGRPVDFFHYGKDLGVYGPVIFAGSEVLKNDPELVERFRSAAECSYLAAHNDPQGALDSLMTAFPDRTSASEMAGIEAGIENMFDPAVYDVAGFNWIPDRVAQTIDFALSAEGIAPGALHVEDVIVSAN